MVCFFAFTRGCASCCCRSVGAAPLCVAPQNATAHGVLKDPNPSCRQVCAAFHQGRAGSSPFPQPSMQTPRSAPVQPCLPRTAPHEERRFPTGEGRSGCLLLRKEVTAAPLVSSAASPGRVTLLSCQKSTQLSPFSLFLSIFPFFPSFSPFLALLLRRHHNTAGCLQGGKALPGDRISPVDIQIVPVGIEFPPWI